MTTHTKHVIAAWAVHAFTMTGIIWATLALHSVFIGQPKMMWLYLGIALLVDGFDGTLARKADVKKYTPHFDGSALDLIIDYLTWTFIPAFFLMKAGLLGPPPSAAIMITIICVSSMFCYANTGMKSTDYYFVGFPAAWNVVAAYMWILDLPVYWNALIIVTLAVLTVLPVKFVHPFRVRKMMPLTIAVTTIWLVTTTTLLAMHPVRLWWVELLWWISGLWFLGVGFWRTLRGRADNS